MASTALTKLDFVHFLIVKGHFLSFVFTSLRDEEAFGDRAGSRRRVVHEGTANFLVCHFSTSGPNSDVVKIPRSLLEGVTDAICYAA
jgi:hypothetical protein